MIAGIPLAIWLGFLTLASLITTLSLGIAVHVFKKNVFNFHKVFAGITFSLAVIYAALALILWFFGVVI